MQTNEMLAAGNGTFAKKNLAKRRRPTRVQRLTPCECCGYPVSQRHHLLEVADYGENDVTTQLCACCHELYHLFMSCFRGEFNASATTLTIIETLRRDYPDRVTFIHNLCGALESAKSKRRHI